MKPDRCRVLEDTAAALMGVVAISLIAFLNFLRDVAQKRS